MEQDVLFARKWDQSRWSLRFNVDLALRTVNIAIVGYAGHNGDVVCNEVLSEVPVEGWSEAYYEAVSRLWSKLELQLDPDR